MMLGQVCKPSLLPYFFWSIADHYAFFPAVVLPYQCLTSALQMYWESSLWGTQEIFVQCWTADMGTFQIALNHASILHVICCMVQCVTLVSTKLNPRPKIWNDWHIAKNYENIKWAKKKAELRNTAGDIWQATLLCIWNCEGSFETKVIKVLI